MNITCGVGDQMLLEGGPSFRGSVGREFSESHRELSEWKRRVREQVRVSSLPSSRGCRLHILVAHPEPMFFYFFFVC